MAENERREPHTPDLPDEAIEELKARRFRERVARVLAVMQEERIDWRAAPFLTPDGRVGVRVLPVEMQRPSGG